MFVIIAKLLTQEKCFINTNVFCAKFDIHTEE